MMAWSFQPTPRRLLQDVRVLTLEPHDRAVLLSLYVGSDEHGRFQHHEIALAVALGMVGGDWSPAAAVERLAGAGLVHLYTAQGQVYGQLDRWDEDLAADHKRKRPRSRHPSPPPRVWERAACDGAYRGGTHEPGNGAVWPPVDPTQAEQRTVSAPRADADRTPSAPRPPNELMNEVNEGTPVDPSDDAAAKRVAMMVAPPVGAAVDGDARRRELHDQLTALGG